MCIICGMLRSKRLFIQWGWSDFLIYRRTVIVVRTKTWPLTIWQWHVPCGRTEVLLSAYWVVSTHHSNHFVKLNRPCLYNSQWSGTGKVTCHLSVFSPPPEPYPLDKWQLTDMTADNSALFNLHTFCTSSTGEAGRGAEPPVPLNPCLSPLPQASRHVRQMSRASRRSATVTATLTVSVQRRPAVPVAVMCRTSTDNARRLRHID